MWVKTNENPLAINTGDCAVRAVSIALDVSWEKAYNFVSTVPTVVIPRIHNSQNVHIAFEYISPFRVFFCKLSDGIIIVGDKLFVKAMLPKYATPNSVPVWE